MIRILCSSALLLSLLNACAAGGSKSSTSSSSTSANAEGIVLQAIDDFCGDTWCEGDFQFVFKKVTLNAIENKTIVDFSMSPLDGEGNVFEVSCTVKGFSNADLIVDEEGGLDRVFGGNLGTCIKDHENSILK